MTLDNELWMLMGGGAVGLGILLWAVPARLLASRGDSFRRIRGDDDCGDDD